MQILDNNVLIETFINRNFFFFVYAKFSDSQYCAKEIGFDNNKYNTKDVSEA